MQKVGKEVIITWFTQITFLSDDDRERVNVNVVQRLVSGGDSPGPALN